MMTMPSKYSRNKYTHRNNRLRADGGPRVKKEEESNAIIIPSGNPEYPHTIARLPEDVDKKRKSKRKRS